MSSAVFGTKLHGRFFSSAGRRRHRVYQRCDQNFDRSGSVDRTFIDKHTAVFAELRAALNNEVLGDARARSGVARADMQSFAALYGQARTAVIVYSMGLTQHEFGVDNVKAIVNLALARGMLGREKCGIMPIRGHSGVQGGGECGAEPDKFPGGFAVNADTARRFSNLWHHPVPSNPGLKVPHMIEAAPARRDQNFSIRSAATYWRPCRTRSCHRRADASAAAHTPGYRAQQVDAARRRRKRWCSCRGKRATNNAPAALRRALKEEFVLRRKFPVTYRRDVSRVGNSDADRP